MASSPTTSPPSDTDSSPPSPSNTPPSSTSLPSAPPPNDSDSSSSSDATPPPPPPPPPNNQTPPPSSTSSPPKGESSPAPSNDNSSPSSSSSSSSSSPPPPSQSPPSSNTSTSPPPPPPSTNDDDSSDSSSPPAPPPPPPPPHQQQQQTHTSPPRPRHPPPPHSGALSPPHSGKLNSTPEVVNVPLVVGVTTGVALFLIMLVVSFLCCNRKKKRHHEVMNYYTDPSRNGSRMSKAGDYYNPGPPAWGPPMDHVMKVPPPPGWHAPPPPPPIMTGSDVSSAYSGPHGPALPPPSPNIALGFNKSTFSYDELAAATNGFFQANLLGQGGFGYVHKGVLPNGKEIAVKSLRSGSGQGEREFQAEVEIISRVHHRHLVSLVGYCIAGGQRMLVYEFVPNGTLEFHLHVKDRPMLDFPTRLKIALGSAKGLAYLHEDCHPKIIHRDIKAANILLDNNFEAMVADFGLAKLSSDNHTHVSTRIMGTFGYLAPEYASSGKLTEKSDVFSFGVMLLELVTGRRPVDSNITEDSLVDWARPLMGRALTDGNHDEVVDPRLENNYSSLEMSRLIACAAASVRHSARRRPKMSQIVRALEGDSSLEDLTDGVKPGISAAFGSSGSSENDTFSYNSQMRKFEKMAMGSEDFGSSEYGATGEYGRNPSSASSGEERENHSPWQSRSKSRQRP